MPVAFKEGAIVPSKLILGEEWTNKTEQQTLCTTLLSPIQSSPFPTIPPTLSLPGLYSPGIELAFTLTCVRGGRVDIADGSTQTRGLYPHGVLSSSVIVMGEGH